MAENDGFVPRLLSASTNPAEGAVHGIGNATRIIIEGLNGKPDLRAIWNIPASGVEFDEFEAIADYVNTGNISQKYRRAAIVEAVFFWGWEKVPQYATPNQVRAKLRDLGMTTIIDQ